jgi:enoyl reductase-like protein
MEQNLQQLLEMALEEMYTLTLELKANIYKEEADPDEWVRITNARQTIINKLSQLQEHGAELTEDHKQKYLARIYEMDQQLIPAMEAKKNEIQKRIGDLNKSKAVNQQYRGGYGYTPYGAFFDKKK